MKMKRSLWSEFVFEFIMGVYVVAAVVLGWHRPVLLSIALGVGLGIQLWYWREKADVAMMIAAALLGGPAEVLCVKLGIWTYRAPGLVFDIPAWIPLVWAFLLCFFRRVTLSIHAVVEILWSGNNSFSRKAVFFVLGGVIAVYYIFTVAVIRRIIAIAYSTIMIPAALFWHQERDIIIFLFGAACGTLGEYICMRLGFWHYHYPHFRAIGLPISLPLAWGLSSVMIGRIARIWEPRENEEEAGRGS
jgi:hypothetical protein